MESFDPATLESLSRKELQALCKGRGIKANSKNNEIIDGLKAWMAENAPKEEVAKPAKAEKKATAKKAAKSAKGRKAVVEEVEEEVPAPKVEEPVVVEAKVEAPRKGRGRKAAAAPVVVEEVAVEPVVEAVIEPVVAAKKVMRGRVKKAIVVEEVVPEPMEITAPAVVDQAVQAEETAPVEEVPVQGKRYKASKKSAKKAPAKKGKGKGKAAKEVEEEEADAVPEPMEEVVATTAAPVGVTPRHASVSQPVFKAPTPKTAFTPKAATPKAGFTPKAVTPKVATPVFVPREATPRMVTPKAATPAASPAVIKTATPKVTPKATPKPTQATPKVTPRAAVVTKDVTPKTATKTVTPRERLQLRPTTTPTSAKKDVPLTFSDLASGDNVKDDIMAELDARLAAKTPAQRKAEIAQHRKNKNTLATEERQKNKPTGEKNMRKEAFDKVHERNFSKSLSIADVYQRKMGNMKPASKSTKDKTTTPAKPAAKFEFKPQTPKPAAAAVAKPVSAAKPASARRVTMGTSIPKGATVLSSGNPLSKSLSNPTPLTHTNSGAAAAQPVKSFAFGHQVARPLAKFDIKASLARGTPHYQHSALPLPKRLVAAGAENEPENSQPKTPGRKSVREKQAFVTPSVQDRIMDRAKSSHKKKSAIFSANRPILDETMEA